MADQDLVAKLNAMSKQELTEFITVAKITEKTSAAVGISAILIALMSPSISIFLFASFILYFVGNLAVGADNAVVYIKHLLETKFKDK